MRIFYHPTEAPLGRAFTLDEEMPLGWFDTPAAFPAAEKEAAPAVESEAKELTKDELLALADELGVAVDRRWGVERLREAVRGDRP